METLLQSPHMPGEGKPETVKVLAYHRIVDDPRDSRAHWSCLHIGRFKRQLELLERWGFTSITFRDYQLYRHGLLNLPAKPVIITFDDGYVDTYRLAFPVLQEFGMKAVFFVLGDRKVKSNYWERAKNVPQAPLMSAQQVVELHEAGFEIGAHSMTHPQLTLISQDDAWQEISRSRILLEILLNDPVTSFSYPYGLLNPTIKRMVGDAGYQFGCGVYTGPAAFGEDSMEIRRITVRNTTGTLFFAARMLMPYQHYAWMRWYIARAVKHEDASNKEIRKILEKKKRRETLEQKVFQEIEEHDSQLR